jgi:D-3-phosphoglycerate dehydrogenase / 2-oxoglutarate reductase
MRNLFAPSSLFPPESHHFISTREIDSMTRKPILINVSRGGLVDTQALIRGLRTNRLSGAGLDVLETEPNVEQETFAA